MKVGYIAEPNSKGQIVIPKKIRDDLKIDENTPLNFSIMGGGIWIHPVREVLTDKELKDSHSLYLEVLNKTRGILTGKPYYKNEQARRKLAGEIDRDSKNQIDFPDAAIAATAILNKAKLLTLNKKDFKGIKGLRLI